MLKKIFKNNLEKLTEMNLINVFIKRLSFNQLYGNEYNLAGLFFVSTIWIRQPIKVFNGSRKLWHTYNTPITVAFGK
jgi:hypothetical protein